MRYSVASTAAFVVAAAAYPQVSSDVAPEATAPEGCTDSYDGEFQIQVMNVTDTMKFKRQSDPQAGADTLMIMLDDGVLTDTSGATGYIAANNQFQFDSPPQTGAIYTAGWSACNNGSLALGGSTVFYQCLSGDFYNLYDESRGNQCNPVTIEIVGADASTNAPASQLPDGQPQATPATQAVSQIGDGQIQAPTGVVSQISDGQIQAPTGVVSQIPDGQVQAPTSAAGVVSQIPDGQIQAPTSTAAGVVSQIPDGQIQAPTSTAAGVVSQIPDGQIQAPTAVVSQIPDGQIQAPFPAANGTAPMASGTGAGPASTVAPYEGAGNKAYAAGGAAIAALFGLVAVL